MFKVGDIITLLPYSEFGIYLLSKATEDKCELTLLAHSDPGYDVFLGSKILYATHAIRTYGMLLISDHTRTLPYTETERHKCRCPKEVWMYQGCKCGGI